MTVDELLGEHDAEVQATARWLRDTLRTAVPDLRERVWPGWHGLGYRHPRAGHVCGIFPRDADVVLVFEHGLKLPDRDGVLTGDGTQTRHVRLTEPGSVPAPVLIALLDAAIDLRS